MNSSRDCERGVVGGAVAPDTSVISADNPVKNNAGITGAPAAPMASTTRLRSCGYGSSWSLAFVLLCFSLARLVVRVGGNGNRLLPGSITSAGNA
jgi:hypothetical protein